MFPKHYSLVKEHDKHFEIHDKRDNKVFSVAKKDLHPANQIKIMKLQKLSDGGQAAPMPDPQKAKDAWAGAQHGEMDRFTGQLKGLMNWGQPVKKYAFGGGPEFPGISEVPEEAPQDQSPWTTQLGKTIGDYGGAALKTIGQGAMDLGQGVGNVVSGIGQGAGVYHPGQMTGVPVGDVPPPGMAGPPKGVDPASLAIDQGAGRAPATGAPPPNPFSDVKKEYDSAMGLQKQSIEGQAAATGQRAEAEAANYGNEAAQLKSLQDRHNLVLNDLNQRSNELFDNISKNKIDPDQYWTGKNGKEGHSKIAAAIGIVLGGLGAGLQKSTTNMALEAINKNIDRNIDGQKAEMGQQNNLFRMNMEKYHNQQEAYLATKSDLLTMTAAKANQIAAKAGTPEANAKKDWLLGQLGMQSAQMHQQLAVAGIGREAYTNGVPAGVVPILPPDQQKRMVRLPDGRMADAGNESNAKEYNEQTAAFNPLMGDLTELKSLNTLGNRMDPAQRDRATALQMHVVTELNDLAKSHRISESDIGFQKGQLSDPNSISNALLSKGNAATDQLMTSLQRKHEAIGAQYVPAFANMRQQQSQAKTSIPFKPSK